MVKLRSLSWLMTIDHIIMENKRGMKLNDPFGRQERRHQFGYESMRDTMRRGGITTPEEAREIIENSKKRALNFLGAGLVLFLLAALLLPKSLPVTICLAVLFAVWIGNSTVNGKRYIERYIDEELSKPKEPPTS